jgi:hypothetical protein
MITPVVLSRENSGYPTFESIPPDVSPPIPEPVDGIFSVGDLQSGSGLLIT